MVAGRIFSGIYRSVSYVLQFHLDSPAGYTGCRSRDVLCTSGYIQKRKRTRKEAAQGDELEWSRGQTD